MPSARLHTYALLVTFRTLPLPQPRPLTAPPPRQLPRALQVGEVVEQAVETVQDVGSKAQEAAAIAKTTTGVLAKALPAELTPLGGCRPGWLGGIRLRAHCAGG